MRKPRIHSLFACIVAGSVFAAACGSDDDDDGSGPAPETGGTSGQGGGGGSGGTPASGGGFVIDDGGTVPPEDASCGATAVDAERRSVNVVLVIDRSLSMNDRPGAFTTSKWDALNAALGDVLPGAGEYVRFGLQLYPLPSTEEDQCGMPAAPGLGVEVGADSVPAILTELGVEPAGGTPTAAALGRALEYYTEGAGKDLDGRRFVILATDGGPNCTSGLSCTAERCVLNIDGQCPEQIANCCAPEFEPQQCLDDDGAVAQVTALREAGVTTLVIGLPGTEAPIYRATLERLAQAGGYTDAAGEPQPYFEVTAAGGLEGLKAVFEDVTTQLITSCELQLTTQPPSLDKLNVEIEGEIVLYDPANGWELDTSTSPPTIVLKGTTCTQVSGEGVRSVQVTYGCKTQRIE